MPLVRQNCKTECREIVFPDKNGNPLGGLSCRRICDGLSAGPASNQATTEQPTTEQPTEESIIMNMNDTLHCPSLRTSIELQNKGANVTTALAAALAAGTSIDLPIPDITLLRTLRFTYFSSSLANPDDVDVTLLAGTSGVQSTVISPTWSGGELAPSNANVCSAYNCKAGYCLGALDRGIIRITNTSAAAIPIGTTFKFKFLYSYDEMDAANADSGATAKVACECQK